MVKWMDEWWGAGVVNCLERGADLHMVQLIPLPLTVSCFSKIQIGFTFLVPAHQGNPGKRPLNGCVCVCVCVRACVCVCVIRSGDILSFSVLVVVVLKTPVMRCLLHCNDFLDSTEVYLRPGNNRPTWIVRARSPGFLYSVSATVKLLLKYSVI